MINGKIQLTTEKIMQLKWVVQIYAAYVDKNNL